MPEHDQKRVLDFTYASLNGDLTALFKGNYISSFPYQLGLSLYETIVLKIGSFGNIYRLLNKADYCVLLLSLVNCVWLSLSFLYGFLIINEFSKDIKNIVLYGFVSLTCSPFILYSVYIYNDIPSLCFSMMALYYFIKYYKTNKIAYVILTIFIMCFAVTIRMTSIIFSIAFSLIVLYDLLFERKKPYLILIAVAIVVLPYKSLNIPIRYYERISNYKEVAGIYGDKLEEGCPYLANIAMGLEIDNGFYGWYSGYNIKTHYDECNFDSKCTFDKSKEKTKNLLHSMDDDINHTAVFFYNKMNSQWGDGSVGGFCLTQNNYEDSVASIFNGFYSNGDFTKIILSYMKAVLIFTYISCLFGIVRKNKNLPMFEYVIEIIVVGGFLFSIFWEAQSRYMIAYVYVLFILSAVYMPEFLETIDSSIAKRIHK